MLQSRAFKDILPKNKNSKIKGVSEQMRVFKQYDAPAHFKPMNTQRQSLVRKILKERVVRPVYYIPCDSCDASYI